ncbi:MAG: hypothetical protein EYX74_01890 [Desulfobulbaceae bacterium]|nr:MAG: hypothetical protein EYX74_01890 [Desulfobulbaceae bacterium]
MCQKKRKILLFNVIFFVVCVSLFLFLWHTPPVTTPYLPKDDIHSRFLDMDRKEAETFCFSCHQPGGIRPLSPDHPTTHRCLFCHRR